MPCLRQAALSSTSKRLELALTTIVQLEAELQNYEEKMIQEAADDETKSIVTLDNDVVQNRLAEEIDTNAALKEQINRLENI